jgi:hypothetical protein
MAQCLIMHRENFTFFTWATNVIPAPDDDDDGEGNENWQGKPVPVSLFPSQIPHGVTCD